MELSWLANGHLTCTWTCPWDTRDTQRLNPQPDGSEISGPFRKKTLEEGGFHFNDNVKSATSCRIPTTHGFYKHMCNIMVIMRSSILDCSYNDQLSRTIIWYCFDLWHSQCAANDVQNDFEFDRNGTRRRLLFVKPCISRGTRHELSKANAKMS